jgi:DNA ligase (NAD+)
MEDLLPLEGFQEKSARNVLGAIEASKQRSLSRVLFALGIPHVGGQTAELLAERFRSITALRHASVDEIAAVEGIGPIIADSVYAFFRDPRVIDLVERLAAAGVRTEEEGEASARGTGPLSGKMFVLTGTLPSLTREQATELIEAAGGRIMSSASRRTDYVVVGDSPGSKLARARTLGVVELDEAALEEMVGHGDEKA